MCQTISVFSDAYSLLKFLVFETINTHNALSYYIVDFVDLRLQCSIYVPKNLASTLHDYVEYWRQTVLTLRSILLYTEQSGKVSPSTKPRLKTHLLGGLGSSGIFRSVCW
jgi:hypothetical protein